MNWLKSNYIGDDELLEMLQSIHQTPDEPKLITLFRSRNLDEMSDEEVMGLGFSASDGFEAIVWLERHGVDCSEVLAGLPITRMQ